MIKTFFTCFTAVGLTFFLTVACAGNAEVAQAAAQEEPATVQAVETTSTEAGSIMDQPVDFSSAEAAEKTMQGIKDREGESTYLRLNYAMKYILLYDLALSNDKDKLYKKLDGKTPNEIIALAKR